MSANEPGARERAQGGHAPTTHIHDAHLRALRARQQYVSAAQSNADGDMMHRAHKQLHRAVFQYLEAMKYLLRTKQTIQAYWDGDPATAEDATFADGTAFLWAEAARAEVSETWVASAKDEAAEQRDVGGDVSVADIRAAFRREHDLPQTARVAFEPAPEDAEAYYRVTFDRGIYGLKHLASRWQQRQEVEQRKTGMLGTRTTTETKAQYLPPQVLLRGGTALDEAADALSLLAQVDESEALPVIRDFDTSGEQGSGDLGYAELNKSPDL